MLKYLYATIGAYRFYSKMSTTYFLCEKKQVLNTPVLFSVLPNVAESLLKGKKGEIEGELWEGDGETQRIIFLTVFKMNLLFILKRFLSFHYK